MLENNSKIKLLNVPIFIKTKLWYIDFNNLEQK